MALATVRVLDGDTKRPVKGALVHVGRVGGRASAGGTAEFELRRYRRFDVRVAARGYIPRRISVRFRSRDAQADVRIWERATQWPIYGATPARTQAHPAIELRPPFRIVWHRWIRSLLEFPAVVWEGVAYVNTFRGDTVAVSMENGRILWRRRVGTTFASSPAVEPERRELVVTTKVPGAATILDMRSGRIKWRYPTAPSEPSPVIANGTAYFADKSGRVYALDLRRRRARWVYSGGVKITASPSLVGGRLYFGDYAGRVTALSARTGRRVWTGSAGSRVYGTAAVAGGRVFVPTVFSGLAALSARTGARLWRIPTGAYTYASPAYYRGRVYFGTYAGIVYCVDARSGRILWSRSVGSAVSGAIVIVAGTVYAASFNHWINAWHWRSGRHLWSINRGEYVPISGNGARLLIHGRSSLTAVVPKRSR